MLRAQQKCNREFVSAEVALKSLGPFFCPLCEEVVVLRKSPVRIAHFAHKATSECEGSLESEAHRKCKKAIYEALLNQPGVEDVVLERNLKTCRPDVSALIRGVKVAVEVQISNLTLETIAKRTAEYTRRGIYVLWLGQWTPYLDGERYSPKLWEKWVHAAYFGRVYYWTEGLSVIPYRFEPKLQLASKGEYGKWSLGAYTRRSKRYRMPVRELPLNLRTDFIAKDREAWLTEVFKIHSSKIYVARY